MKSVAWLACLFLSWVVLSVCLALAVFRHAIPPEWKDYVILAGGILCAGVVPLTWLRLNDELNQVARSMASRALGHWVGSASLLGVLLGAAVLSLWSALRMQHLEFRCEPSNLQVAVDGTSVPGACKERVWVAPGSELVANAEDYVEWRSSVSASEQIISIVLSPAPPKFNWSCSLQKLEEVQLDSCPSGATWSKAARFSLKLSRRSLPPEIDVVVRPHNGKGLGLIFEDPAEHGCDPVGSGDPTVLEDNSSVRIALTRDCIGTRTTLDWRLTVCVDQSQRPTPFSFERMGDVLEFYTNGTEDDDLYFHCL